MYYICCYFALLYCFVTNIKLSENFDYFFDFIQYVIIIHNFIKFSNTFIQFIYILLSYIKVSMIIVYFILMYVVIYN